MARAQPQRLLRAPGCSGSERIETWQIEALERAAAAGNALAQNNLGTCCWLSLGGVARDTDAAEAW
jgi:hypothetical protein